MGISALKQCPVCKHFKPHLERTVPIMDKFNEKRRYFLQGRKEIQHFLGSFSLDPLPNRQTLYCPTPPPLCSYPNIPRNCPILRTFKTLTSGSICPRCEKRAKSLEVMQKKKKNVNVTFTVKTLHAYKFTKLYLWPAQLS